MGVQWLHDPDRAYELTTDNVKKILAIHMRFRYVLVIPSHFLFAQCGIKLSISVLQVDHGSAKCNLNLPFFWLFFFKSTIFLGTTPPLVER